MIFSSFLFSPKSALLLALSFLFACFPLGLSFGSIRPSCRQQPPRNKNDRGLLCEPAYDPSLVTRTATKATVSTSEAVTGADLPSSYEERQVLLDTGVSMKVTLGGLDNHNTSSDPQKPVLLFLHGSFHGGWCWTEKFFAHYIEQGYTVVAPCWRGTGGTYAGDGVKKVQIQQHVADLRSLLQQLPTIIGSDTQSTSETTIAPIIKPVLIAHSFGSLAVMKLFELYPDYSSSRHISGIVTMCGVPPSGNGRMTMRFLRKSLVQSYKITVGFAMKKCLTNAALCRDLFFGGPPIKSEEDGTTTIDNHGISDADVERYQAYFARDSEATIDLFDLAKQLPSEVTVEGGKAPFDLPMARMVLGAKQDYIVDQEGVEETARFFDTKPVYVDSPHDVMLGSQWMNAAQELDRFLDENFA